MYSLDESAVIRHNLYTRYSHRLYRFQLTQLIKLYPPGAPANAVPTDTTIPVVAEKYDEVVFTNPTETFFKRLQSIAHAPTIKYKHDEHLHNYTDTEDMKALLEAQKFLQGELAMVKERLSQIDGELTQVDDALRRQHEERKSKAISSSSRSSIPTSSSKTTSSSRAPPTGPKK